MKWVVGVTLLVFLGIQFANPSRTNPPVVRDITATTPPPPEITTLLHAACYDCHSYETKWPWYSHVAPVSWLVVGDVNKGRRHLDFSDWPTDPSEAARKLERINDVLDYREMPPRKYTLMHPQARLTEVQRQQLLDWSDAAARELRATSTNQ